MPNWGTNPWRVVASLATVSSPCTMAVLCSFINFEKSCLLMRWSFEHQTWIWLLITACSYLLTWNKVWFIYNINILTLLFFGKKPTQTLKAANQINTEYQWAKAVLGERPHFRSFWFFCWKAIANDWEACYNDALAFRLLTLFRAIRFGWHGLASQSKAEH